jgi:hypothetical protein
VPGLIKLFVNIAIIALGILLSRRYRLLADSVACGLGILCIAIGLVIGVSGAFHGPPAMRSLHHWTGLGITIAIWCSCLFSLGVAMEQARSRGIRLLTARFSALAFALLLGFFASFTGYLGPAHDPEIPRDMHNRFIVLHMFVVPLLLGIPFTFWCYLFWPQAQREDAATADRDPHNE